MIGDFHTRNRPAGPGHRLASVTCLILIALFVLLPNQTPIQAAEEQTPLPSHPGFAIGELENGMTYMIKEHQTPPGWVAIRLLVTTGSLNEEEDQRGLAHFFEHLAFNGSANFAPGTLIPTFEDLGVEFGRNLNANTGFDRTLYIANLPRNDPEMLHTGLLWASDVAYRIGLTPDEIEKERGIIIEEWRTGLGPDERITKAMWSALMPGARLPVRWPIGTIKVIKAADRNTLQRYYDSWYRPNKMTLMIVGDIKIDEVIPTVKELFNEPARDNGANASNRTAGITPYTAQNSVVVTDPEFVGCDVDFIYLDEATPPATTTDAYRRQQVLAIAAWMFNRRLDQMIAQGGMPFRSAQVAVAPVFQQFTYSSAGISCEPANWKPSLDILSSELKRIYEHGAVQSELDRASNAVIAQAKAFAAQESTLPSPVIASIAITQVNAGDSLMSATQAAELLEQVVPTITLEEINAVYRDYFDPSRMAFTLTLPDKDGIKAPTDEDLLAAARQGLNERVDPYTEEAMVSSLMSELPAAGKKISTSKDEDLGVTTTMFANSVILHHKFNDFRQNSVTVTISVEGGEIEETAETRGLTDAAVAAMNQSATSTLTSSQIQDLMSDKNVGVSVGASGRDAVQIAVSGLPEDLENGLQLAHLLLTDPIVEDSAFLNWRDATLEEIDGRRFDPIANLRRELASARTDDPRYALISKEDVDRITSSDVRDWMRRIAGENPIEISVVGDMPYDDVAPLIARYAGSLADRSPVGSVAAELSDLDVKQGPQHREAAFVSQEPVALGFVCFRGPNASDVKEKRLMEVASSIMSTRLMKEVREERGIVYSIGAMSAPADVYPDVGLFYAVSECAPANANELVDVALSMFDEFAEDGPSDEEVQTALAQIVSNLSKEVQEPGYWSEALNRLQIRRSSLDEYRDHVPFYENEVTADDVREIFSKYFQPDRIITVKILAEAEDKDQG